MISTLLNLIVAAQATTISVDGEGYLRFARADKPVYFKQAELTVKDGKLVNSLGDPTLPAISLAGPTFSVDLEGNVFEVHSGSKTRIGRLVLAMFPANTPFVNTDGALSTSTRPTLGNPGEDLCGVIRIGVQAPSVPTTTGSQGQQIKPDETTLKGAKITLKEKADVPGRMILLGDIATIEGAPELVEKLKKIELGAAPAPGAKRTIDRLSVALKLRNSGYKSENLIFLGDKPVQLTGKGYSVTFEQFLETAQISLDEVNTNKLTYKVDEKPSDITVPPGRVTLVTEAVTGVNTPTVTVLIGIYIETKRHNSRTLRFKLQQAPVLIKSGSPVKVLMKSGSAVVELSGIARGAGGLGSNILVEVTASKEKTTHSAVIISANTVEVTLS
ncbi:MAG: flagella basal body P-ring formation protein FlgA [Fimbriimonadaceae bacterium]